MVDRNFLSRVVQRSPFYHRYFNLHTGEVGDISMTSLKLFQLEMKRMLRNRYFYAALVLPGPFAVLALEYLQRTTSNFTDAASALALLAGLALLCLIALARVPLGIDRRLRRECRAYAGGHVILRTGIVSDFIRQRYRDEAAAFQESLTGGRPRHPAFEWYEARAFQRNGLTIKALQAAMPKDEKGAPPSESTIRGWERDFQQKPPPESLQAGS